MALFAVLQAEEPAAKYFIMPCSGCHVYISIHQVARETRSRAAAGYR